MATTTSYYHNNLNSAYNYRYNQRFTPPQRSSSPLSNNTSPISLNHPPPKQIFQHRQCGYIPAALRPTEMPVKRRPNTPPRSAHSSLDSHASKSTLDSASMPVTPIDDVNAFIAPLAPVTSLPPDDFEQELGQVTGEPTTGHWRPDSTASCCTSPICTAVFSLFVRRHHCRRCGGIFCTNHSAKTIPLDQEARFHPKGTMARSCDDCANDFDLWQRDRKSRASSIASGYTAPTPAQLPILGPDHQIRGADLIASEPRSRNAFGGDSVRDTDWNWSTF